MKSSDINLEMIKIVAERIGGLREAFVFLGGASTCLLITDSAAPEIRPTLDVDIIVEVASRLEYHKLEEMLRQLGFSQGTEPDDPICRWVVEDVKVDSCLPMRIFLDFQINGIHRLLKIQMRLK
jgi:hypothetical protein